MGLRIIQSGTVLEVYRYDKPIGFDYTKFADNKLGTKVKPEEWKGKEEFSLNRSKRQIRRTIWANLNKYSKFMTLTYAENMQDIERFYYDFKMMMKTLKRKGVALKYLYVLEYQERGAIHCHMIIFNDEYIPWQTLRQAWGKGNIDIHQIRHIKNLGSYVCKYLTKDTLAEYNSKSYSVSRGLQKSVETKISPEDGANINQAIKFENSLVYQNTFDVVIDDIITNTVEYSQYRLNSNSIPWWRLNGIEEIRDEYPNKSYGQSQFRGNAEEFYNA